MLPKEHRGISFGEVLKKAADLRHKNLNVIPIAVRRGDDVYVNPTAAKVERLQPGDILYAICDNRADLEQLLQ